MENVTITANSVRAVSPEGKSATISIEQFLKKLTPQKMDTCDVVLPDGIKAVLTQGPITIWVHQTPPCVYQFKWIAKDSKIKYGRGTQYRMVTISLPYLIVLGVFMPGEHGRLQISGANECFFRTQPLSSLDDELFYPGLLNCSKFTPQEGRPLSWICTQYLDRNQFVNQPDQNKCMRAGFKTLLHCLLDTGFNYSSEHHEGASWFSESMKVDPRISTIERWEAESQKDPMFVLDVPWIKTGHSVKQVVQRIFKTNAARITPMASAADVARIVFNSQAS